MSWYENLNTLTAATAGDWARIAFASSIVNALRCFKESGTPPLNWMPGRMRRMYSVLLPNDLMFCSNERWNPLMSDTMPITVPTPMTMPSSASIERMRFAVSARRAIVSVSSMRKPRFTGALSFVAQRLDRIEAGRTRGRVGAEEDADAGAHDHAEQHRAQAQRRRQRAHRAHEQRERGADQDAHDAARERQRRRLDQELGEDVAPAGAQGLADADLARSLGHRHEHDVHDHDAAHEQRDRGDADRDHEDAAGERAVEREPGVGGGNAEAILLPRPLVPARAQDVARLLLRHLQRRLVHALHRERQRSALLPVLPERLDRHGDEAVLRLAEDLALRLGHAHDLELVAVDAHQAAERVERAEQLLGHLG